MAAQQQQGSSDNSNAFMWIIAASFAAIGAIWVLFKKYIILFYLHVKLAEANFLNAFSGHSYMEMTASINQALIQPMGVDFSQLFDLGGQVGAVLRYPICFVLIVLAVVVYFGSSVRSFKNTYSMKKFSTLEATNWPQIVPVVKLDLLNTDIDKGPWAMALSPIQFCKRHNLIQEVRPERREGMSRSEWDRIDVVLMRGKANKVFALQLGPLWRGVDKLPMHMRALFAAFAARINSDTKSAENLLMQLARTSTSKLDFSGTNELLKKHTNTKLVKQITDSHAYVLTVMASMLMHARDDGVQASADFLWLKPLDRRLWYTLNSVGRQTPYAEVGGIFAHWFSEKEARRKILVPMVEEATNGLEVALKEVVYRRDEE